MIAIRRIEEKIEKFDPYFRLKVKWNGKDRTSSKTIRINLTTSKMDTCSNHKITRLHSCANAETPEDCESSCGVASGFYRWQCFPFLFFHVNANEIYLEKALFSSSFSNRFQRNTALQIFFRIDPLFSRGNFSGQCMWRWNKRSNQVSMMSDHYPTCSPNLSYCPDNMCDELEQLDPRICPQDCTIERKFLIFFFYISLIL